MIVDRKGTGSMNVASPRKVREIERENKKTCEALVVNMSNSQGEAGSWRENLRNRSLATSVTSEGVIGYLA